MAKQPSKQPTHNWAVYHIRGRLIAIVHNQPDEQSAMEKAIEEYKVRANQRNRLIARRLD
jgi:hypothetical protein